MLAGDVAPSVATASGDVTVSNQTEPTSAIVFLDAGMDESDALIESIPESAELVLLQRDRDAIEQITKTLNDRRDIETIHLVGHGGVGRIALGDQLVDSKTLVKRRSEIASWGKALSAHADILVYGCDTGQSSAGLRFACLLSEITGADVAASTDTTGNDQQGGNWVLERHIGLIESPALFDPIKQSNLEITLPIQIRAAGSTGQETMELQINGQVVATFNDVGGDAEAGLFQTFNYAADGVDPSLVRVAFTNDLYLPDQGLDRNLRVDSVIIDGTTYESEDTSVFSTGTWKPEDGITPGFRESEFLHGNGYFEYAGASGSTLIVTASGSDGRENFDLRIDGDTVASFASIGTAERDFTYVANTIVTPDQVSIAFTNDRYEPDVGIDYNLDVNRISIDGATYETESPSVFSTGTWKPEDGISPGFRESETLHTNGTFQYGSNSTSPLPTIRINSGGDEYIDAQGNTWQADQYFDGGNLFSTSASIFQTDDDALYQTERWATDLSYDIPIENGAYEVNLHFAEIFFDDFGQRIFDVTLEDQLIEDDLDIYERARNAFFPGNNNALVINSGQVLVNDGVLDLELSASVNNAKLSAIEIKPLTGPGLLLSTSGGIVVTENGPGDSYQIRLNEAPSSNVVVSLETDFGQISTDKSSLTFTPNNWQTPQTVFVSAVDDADAEGVQFASINHRAVSGDPRYNNQSSSLDVRVEDNDVVPIEFTQRTIAFVENPTTAAWGPDGRLYVGSTTGTITALSLDNNDSVIATETISTLSGLSNNNILGIAFNPFESSQTPRIYVSHSQLFANGGSSFPETELSPYSGEVSVLSGGSFENIEPLITGLPVSNHDHGINGLAFDNAGDLYVAVGGNTNAGIVNSNLGGIPESPFSAAVLKADISKADFNGDIDYQLVPGFTPPSGLSFDAADSQTWGDQVRVVDGVDVRVYSSGLRNPYDIVFTTDGLLYATDNGPNNGFGDVSTGPNTQVPVTGAPDELNLLADGSYHGHPNRTRGLENPIENIYFGPSENSTGAYTAPLASLPSSTNGIDEYRSLVFGGQLQGQLVTQRYNGEVIFVERSSDGFSAIGNQSYNTIADGLDLVVGSGGTLFGIDFAQDRITVATPNVPNPETVAAYDLSVWRANAEGGSSFTIGGTGFGNFSDTTVTIGGVDAQVTSVFENRITGVFPNLTGSAGAFVDVIVTSAGVTSRLDQAFLPLV